MSNSIPNAWPMPGTMPVAEFQVRNIRKDGEWMRVSEDAYNDTSDIGFQSHIWERRKLYSAPEGCTLVNDFDLNLLRERADIPLRIGKGEVWHWQGDGHDFPESLNCPVIMTADTLRELLRRRPLPWQTGAAEILRRAANILCMWEGDPNETGYLGDFGDACAILELLAQHADPADKAVDLTYIRELASSWRTVKMREGMGWREAVSHCADNLDVALSLIDNPCDAAKAVKS